MRFVALLIGLVVLSGCDNPVVKDTFMSLDQMKKTKRFAGYEIVIGPVLLDGLKSCEELELEPKKEDETIPNANRFLVPADWSEQKELEVSGPIRMTKEVYSVIRMETMEMFHRRIKVGDKYYYFKLEEDVKGYGFQFVSVRDKQQRMGVMVLKTVAEVPSWDDPKNRVGQGVDPFYQTRREKRKKKSDDESEEKTEDKSSEESEDK